MDKLAEGLNAISQGKKVFYLSSSPEVIDFTKKQPFKLFIFGEDLYLEVNLKEDNLIDAKGMLSEIVFSKGVTCLSWNIKNILSTFWKLTGKKLEIEAQILDLKIAEAYMGRHDEAPKTYAEAMDRAKALSKQNQWKAIYRNVHLPLIQDVIPLIETTGVLDIEQRRLLHPYYEIEGTKNGRMKCALVYEHSFNPHSLGPDQRNVLRPPGEDNWFVFLDFKFMEVFVLQYISQDKDLKKILDSGEDFYKAVFKIILGRDCENENHRNFIKSVFLPVVFGLTAKGLAEDAKKSEKFAEHIINTINSKFPAAMSCVQEHQYDTELSDYLGRVRKFEDRSSTKVRNFVVQSPASTVCLEKLVALRIALRKCNASLGFHIHDGYLIYARKEKCKYIAKTAKAILESPSELMPGLSLKTTCKLGPTLDDLQPVDFEGEI